MERSKVRKDDKIEEVPSEEKKKIFDNKESADLKKLGITKPQPKKAEEVSTATDDKTSNALITGAIVSGIISFIAGAGGATVFGIILAIVGALLLVLPIKEAIKKKALPNHKPARLIVSCILVLVGLLVSIATVSSEPSAPKVEQVYSSLEQVDVNGMTVSEACAALREKGWKVQNVMEKGSGNKSDCSDEVNKATSVYYQKEKYYTSSGTEKSDYETVEIYYIQKEQPKEEVKAEETKKEEPKETPKEEPKKETTPVQTTPDNTQACSRGTVFSMSANSQYEVGKDLKPGTYKAKDDDGWASAGFTLYQDRNAYNTKDWQRYDYIWLLDDDTIQLKNGNILDSGSSSSKIECM